LSATSEKESNPNLNAYDDPTPFLVQVGVALVIAGLIFGAFTSAVAGSKNRSQSNWFLAGFFFNFAALLAVGFMPALERNANIAQQSVTPPRAGTFHEHAAMGDGCQRCLEVVEKFGMTNPTAFCPEGQRLASTTA
jgi:hypothetical protein